MSYFLIASGLLFVVAVTLLVYFYRIYQEPKKKTWDEYDTVTLIFTALVALIAVSIAIWKKHSGWHDDQWLMQTTSQYPEFSSSVASSSLGSSSLGSITSLPGVSPKPLIQTEINIFPTENYLKASASPSTASTSQSNISMPPPRPVQLANSPIAVPSTMSTQRTLSPTTVLSPTTPAATTTALSSDAISSSGVFSNNLMRSSSSSSGLNSR